jgi:uncharacterized protein (DUF1800 family)
MAFGPRPGEITEVAGFGVLHFADRMLDQARPEDPALAARQREFDSDRFGGAELWRRIREVRRLRRAAKADSAMDPSREQVDEVRRTIAAYQQLTLVRAITGRDQLREVMADFWANHFNVYLNKGADRAYLPEYIESVIRPRALGRFEDLLVATAKSPAMLFYLDNVQSVAPGTRPRARLRNDSLRAKAPTGLNENYARELMELHTLGVDGGYTQRDVTEVARVLTGWSITPPDRGSGFLFRERAHDAGAKTFMGIRFPAGHGIDEGERLLHILATSPATMHHVSRKLCARLVADDPPDGCVDAAVHAWEESDGQILAVLRAIVHSPEFWSSAAVGSKVKSPLEFIASAARAAGIVPDTLPALALTLGRLGQPLFQQASPAGYPEREEDWVNSGALLQRMNLAVALAAGRIPGSHPDLSRLAVADGDRAGLLRDLDHELFADRMSSRTRDAITHELADLADPEAERMLAVGLALGSPEFQRQ